MTKDEATAAINQLPDGRLNDKNNKEELLLLTDTNLQLVSAVLYLQSIRTFLDKFISLNANGITGPDAVQPLNELALFPQQVACLTTTTPITENNSPWLLAVPVAMTNVQNGNCIFKQCDSVGSGFSKIPVDV